MEITCLDRYDKNSEHNDISDMSNHSERSSNITSSISITSNNNKVGDHRYLSNNTEIVQINSCSTSYDDEDDDDDEESNNCCTKCQSLILWLRMNYVDIFRGIGSKFI